MASATTTVVAQVTAPATQRSATVTVPAVVSAPASGSTVTATTTVTAVVTSTAGSTRTATTTVAAQVTSPAAGSLIGVYVGTAAGSWVAADMYVGDGTWKPVRYQTSSSGTADTFTVDTTKPTASNTGPAAGGFSSPTVVNGDVAMAAGEVRENQIINGYVTMASGSVLRGCIVQGRNAGTYPNRNSLVSVAAGLATPPVIEYCQIRPYAVIHYSMNDLVLNGPAVVRRCDISGGVDFIKAAGTWGTSGEIVSNYFHGYAYHNDDADQASSTPAYVSHNDAVQVNNGITGFSFHGNTVEMYYEPSLSVGAPDSASATGWGCTFTMSGGVITGLDLHHNWISGGSAAFQANQTPASGQTTTMGRVAYNRVSFDQYTYSGGSKYQIRYNPSFADLTDQLTNYFDGTLPGVAAAGLSGQTFVVGTTATSGIRRG